MLKILFEIMLYFFGFYGLISLIQNIFNNINNKSVINKLELKTIIIIKNQEEYIEGILSTLMHSDLLKEILKTQNLYIIDENSTDNTIDILKKLQKKFEFIKIYKKNNYNYDIFENIDEIK